MSRNKKWIGFDYDGTLSTHFNHIKDGEGVDNQPVENIVNLMREYQKQGFVIKILTARSDPNDILQVREQLKNLGFEDIEITNVKDRHMRLLYDDRAIGVIRNTGVTHEDLFFMINEFAQRMPLDTPFRTDILKLSSLGYSCGERARKN